MTEPPPSTSEHRGPARPEGTRGRAALICALPRPLAFPLPDSGTVIGRVWLAEHGLADTEVSTSHLKIDRAGGTLRVADAGSRNGTWVNGARLAPRDVTPLDDGSVLRIGRTLFVYREALKGPFEPSAPVHGLVGPFGLRALLAGIEAVACSAAGAPRGNAARTSNVLIQGETGTGKELIAQAVAAAAGRATPFAAVNVAGVARGVFESQLFGHVAGAFSDARSGAPGIFLAHDRGTVFLDEIGDLDLDLQAKLLRVLENREVLPVGAQKSVRIDVLVIAATNRDLSAMVDAGTFRRDLFARLAMAQLHVPALRERREDVFAIMTELARRAGIDLAAEHVEVEAIERLVLARWPNNVRELSAAMAAVHRLEPEPGPRLWAVEEVLGDVQEPVIALTEEQVAAAIASAGGNVSAAAEKLGVSRGKLLRFRKRAT